MRNRIRLLVTSTVALSLVACAAAPRGPATSLSEAGVKATSTFATEVRTVSSQLAYVDVLDAFTVTYEACQGADAAACQERTSSEAAIQARADFVGAVALRGQALDGLRGAYEALGREAAFNESAAFEGAAGRLVDGVNRYTAAVSALGPPGSQIAQLITQPIGAGFRLIAGLVGESRQRRRIMAASRQIREAVAKLRDGLQAEAGVFDTTFGYLVLQRTAARRALLDAGLISRSAVLGPLAQNLSTPLVANADAVIAGSPKLRTSVDATLDAMSRVEFEAMRQRYRTSVGALTALIEAHQQLEAGQDVSLADLVRILGLLDAALGQAPNS